MSDCAEQRATCDHDFTIKTFHKITHCTFCNGVLWGLVNQGYYCRSLSSAWAGFALFLQSASTASTRGA